MNLAFFSHSDYLSAPFYSGYIVITMELISLKECLDMAALFFSLLTRPITFFNVSFFSKFFGDYLFLNFYFNSFKKYFCIFHSGKLKTMESQEFYNSFPNVHILKNVK